MIVTKNIEHFVKEFYPISIYNGGEWVFSWRVGTKYLREFHTSKHSKARHLSVILAISDLIRFAGQREGRHLVSRGGAFLPLPTAWR